MFTIYKRVRLQTFRFLLCTYMTAVLQNALSRRSKSDIVDDANNEHLLAKQINKQAQKIYVDKKLIRSHEHKVMSFIIHVYSHLRPTTLLYSLFYFIFHIQHHIIITTIILFLHYITYYQKYNHCSKQ